MYKIIQGTKMDLFEELNIQKRKVDFNTYDISVKELISMVGDKIIDIAPEYQRQFRWDEERESALIESIFLGIPIPSLFMATNRDGSWELIDGVQRLSSIIHFVGNKDILKIINLDRKPLKLKKLTKLVSFNNKTFEDFPKTVTLDFLLKPLKITTLSDKSDLEVRFDLFERLNTGGVKLTDQEIRSCVFRGQFNDFIKKMSENEAFHHAVKLTKSMENDGTREEFVLRFFAFLNNYENFEHSVVDFLNNYMKESIKNFDYQENEKIFIRTFSQLSTLPRGIVRNRSTTPVNLFEGIAVGAALALQNQDNLNMNNITDWMNSEDLKKSTTGATNSKLKVKERIESSRDIFLTNV